MLYRNEDGRFPSLLVEDGETFTISVRNAHETGITVLNMRPRTTAALLVSAGQTPSAAPRLSDRAAFEQIEWAEGFVNFTDIDQDGRIDGYSVPFLRGVLAALDPNEKVPPKSVMRLFPLNEGHKDCGCSPIRHLKRNVTGITLNQGADDVDIAATHSVRETFVPDFMANLRIVCRVTALQDIVVGRGATLVLDSDTNFLIANNFLAYKGSRIVQRASYFNLDVTNIMRGGLKEIIIRQTPVSMTVDLNALAKEPHFKP